MANTSPEDFVTLSKLGQGGYGTVFLVRRKTTAKLYALKLVPKMKMTSVKDVERAITESEVMQKLDSPFVAKLQGAFQDDSHLYYLMEFVGGGDLTSHLNENGGSFPESWCQLYTAEIATAIEHVHSHGFVKCCPTRAPPRTLPSPAMCRQSPNHHPSQLLAGVPRSEAAECPRRRQRPCAARRFRSGRSHRSWRLP